MSATAKFPVNIVEPKKRLWEYLPAIYQDPDDNGGENVVRRFLAAFERLFLDSGMEADSRDLEIGLEQEPFERTISRLHFLVDPRETPDEFLPWLASWAALSLRSELSSTRKRKLIARIIPLYRIRGTRRYLEELLTICLDAISSVSDATIPALEVGVHSTIGADTHIGGGPAHFFRVRLIAPELNAPEVEKQCRLAESIIELAKPAHTYYELEVVSREFQVGIHSTVGLDTILGRPSG
jgi:phage tail-like protein